MLNCKKENRTFDHSEENTSKENLQKNIFSISEHIIAVKGKRSVTDLKDTDFSYPEDNEIYTELYSAEIQKEFVLALKSGIYKELHKRSLLSDEQLCVLLNRK